MNSPQDYISKLCDIGGEVYVVGGANRNYLTNCIHNKNIPIKDFDFLVRNLEATSIIEVLAKIGSVKEVGQAFGIILFTIDTINGKDSIEFALPRTEVSTGSGYKDFIITPDPYLELKDDFSRRDATINAIGYQVYSINDLLLFDHKNNPSPDFDKFIDPFDGIRDIQKKIWRSIGDPYKRFLEDPTRIMRAFRQSGELNLSIDDITYEGIKKHYSVMKTLIPQSYVRLYKELLKLLNASDSGNLLFKMYKLDILNFLGIDNIITPRDINKLNQSTGIVKFAVLLRPEKMKTNVKQWIHDKQILATSCITQKDLYVLMSIQAFTTEIMEASYTYELHKETDGYSERSDKIFRLLKVRENIYKYAKYDSNDVFKIVLEYINVRYYTNYDIESIMTLLSQYIFSTDQLAISGDIIMNRWYVTGKRVGDIKTKLINAIFQSKITNDKDELISHVNKFYTIFFPPLDQKI
jgi:tRNA nucleotidyltransferase/poly(A) polymerase